MTNKNIDSSTEKDFPSPPSSAFREEGWNAHKKGKDISDVPYTESEEPEWRRMSWEEGWRMSREGKPIRPEKFAPDQRFRVISGSESGHCCFEATIVDLRRPEYHDEGYFMGYYGSVCEAFNNEDAEMICSALNKQNTN